MYRNVIGLAPVIFMGLRTYNGSKNGIYSKIANIIILSILIYKEVLMIYV